MSEEPRLSEAMGLVAELASVLGVRAINTLPGPWVHKVDEHWAVSVNATKTEQRTAPDNLSMDILIKPYEMAVWWNGWWAGILTPFGGIIAAGESVRVYPERRVGAEWQVPWEYEGIMSVSRHATAEEARRLYAVLAAAMVGPGSKSGGEDGDDGETR